MTFCAIWYHFYNSNNVKRVLLPWRSVTFSKVTGENPTHRAIKSAYRKKESQLMLKKLSNHPQKVPATGENDMLKMVNDSLECVKFDKNKTLKNFIGYRCAG